MTRSPKLGSFLPRGQQSPIFVASVSPSPSLAGFSRMIMASSNNCSNQLYVFAWQSASTPVEDDALPTSLIFVTFNVEIVYESEKTATRISGDRGLSLFSKSNSKSIPKTIRNLTTQKYRFPLHSFLDEDGEVVSAMISDMKIPFSLENMYWRPRVFQSGTPVANQDELVKCIVDVACDMLKKHDSNVRKEFLLHIDIRNEVILPHHEYEELVKFTKDKEREHNINVSAIEYVMEYQASSRKILSRIEVRRLTEDALRAEAISLDRSELESLTDKAMRSLEQAWTFRNRGQSGLSSQSLAISHLETGKYCGAHLSFIRHCAICLQEAELGSYVNRLPCSHMFHSECIRAWLMTSASCPLCRCSLDKKHKKIEL